MTLLLAVVFVLTVYRVTRLVTTDDFPPILRLREWALVRWPSEDTTYTNEYVTASSGDVGITRGGAEVFWTDGEWVPADTHWFGELITCGWCASPWIATLALPLFWLWPDIMTWVGLVPAASAVTGLLTTQE